MVSNILINLEYSHVDGTDFVFWFFMVLRAQLWVATGSKVNLSTVFYLPYLFSPNWSLPGPQVLVSAIWSIAGFWIGQRMPEIISVLSLCVSESHSVSAAVLSAVCAAFAHRQLNQLLLRQRSQTGKTCCCREKKKKGSTCLQSLPAEGEVSDFCATQICTQWAWRSGPLAAAAMSASWTQRTQQQWHDRLLRLG